MNTGDKKESQQKVFRPFSPLTDPDDDQLGFAPFAEHIARSIVSFGSEENIAISINGAWGSGKTTFLEFVKSYIREHNKNGISVKKNNIRGSIYENAYLYKSFKWFDSLVCGDTCDKSNKLDDKLILVEFNPWLVVDQNQLINEFFSTLNKALKSKVSRIDGSLLTKTISEYVSLLEPVPLVGSYAKSVGGALKVISDKLEKNLNDKKEELRNILKKTGFKIIFFIDDLDRLFPKEMYLMFQLIKSILDFPNIIYVVAFDSDYVCESLQQEFKGLNAQKYLEKIFQMPFHIPQSSCDNLSYIVMRKIIEKYPFNDKVEQDDIYDLFKFTQGIFKTYRDVTRFLETISFTYPPVKDDVYPIDFIGIELLRIFHPDQHDYIFSNIDHLLASDDGTLKQIYKDEIIDMCDNIDKYLKQAMNLVYFLFPSIDNNDFHPDENHPYKSKVGRYIDKSRKAYISRRDKYPNYFKFDYVSPTIKQSELDEIEKNLNNKDVIFKMIEEKSREEVVPGRYKSSDICDFLARKNTIDMISNEFISHYISFLHSKGDELALINIDYLKAHELKHRSDLNKLKILLTMLYMRINEGRFDIIFENIQNTNFNNILINVSFVDYCNYHVMNSDGIPDFKSIIAPDDLEKLKRELSKKMEIHFNQSNWQELGYAFYGLLIGKWLKWDKEGTARRWFLEVFSKNYTDSAIRLITEDINFDSSGRLLSIQHDMRKFLMSIFGENCHNEALPYINELKNKIEADSLFSKKLNTLE